MSELEVILKSIKPITPEDTIQLMKIKEEERKEKELKYKMRDATCELNIVNIVNDLIKQNLQCSNTHSITLQDIRSKYKSRHEGIIMVDVLGVIDKYYGKLWKIENKRLDANDTRIYFTTF